MKRLILPLAFLFFVGCQPQVNESDSPALVQVEQVEAELEKGVQLVDVRTEEEWNEGHLKGATLLTVTEDDFLEKAKATLDPSREVLVYCRSGNRSAKAANQLREAGFTVSDLEGGIKAWENAGKEVVK